MSVESNPRRRVAVAGDVTSDWYIAHENGESHAFAGPGCAALLGQLMKLLVARDGAGWELDVPEMSLEGLSPLDTALHHRYSTWTRYGGISGPAWRMSGFLGTRRAQTPRDEPLVRNDPDGVADLTMIDDEGLGYRDHPARWPVISQKGWTIFKTTAPVGTGALSSHILEAPQRLVVLLTVDDLRRSEVRVSRDLSWERTAQDLAWEIVHNARINSLARAAHVVVSFGAAGAFVLSRGNQMGSVARLIFDPRATERSWEDQHPGGVFGAASSLAAGIASRILESPEAPDIADGIGRGLSALRALHRTGFCEQPGAGFPAELSFPFETVIRELDHPGYRFSSVEVRDPLRHAERGWSILEDRHPGGLSSVARRIVLDGVDHALDGVPLGIFGGLVTVDRREIESFRSIRALVREYISQGKARRPLNLAVFGTPGSGKSFGITQVAESLAPGQIRTLEFNLSQFDDAHSLHDALHQVRDAALTGSIPLVFWDEFDTALNGQSLGWLRHFLAPMQDGRFQEGQITHPIGRAIFVFAGGTSARMREFGGVMESSGFRAAKGPDFVSRLRGYVDILGPNPHPGEPDPYYMIRRAILARGMLERDAPWIFTNVDRRRVPDVDPGILTALLETRVYRHGARSLESILGMSSLTNRGGFERSALPAANQLDIHVDAEDFLACVQRLEIAGDLLERMAEAAHSVFTRMTRRRDPDHTSLVPFAELPPDERDQNRDNVRDIPQKLADAGYVMTPARSNEPPFRFPGDALERLAQREHERWVRAKLAAGWRHAPVTDKAAKLHQALVPWIQTSDPRMYEAFGEGSRNLLGACSLPEDEKEKDRALVRAIPEILAEAGYTIVPAADVDSAR